MLRATGTRRQARPAAALEPVAGAVRDATRPIAAARSPCRTGLDRNPVIPDAAARSRSDAWVKADSARIGT